MNNLKVDFFKDLHEDIGQANLIALSATKSLIVDVQNQMYGRDIVDDFKNGFIKKLPNFKEGIESAKNVLEYEIAEYIDNPEFQEITTREIWDQSEFDRNNQDHINQVVNNIIQWKEIYNYLDKGERLIYQTALIYKNFNRFAQLAFPFLNIKNGTFSNDAGAELEAENESGNQNVNIDNELMNSTARHLFERSEISALGTMSEAVKFFLYNTIENNEVFLSDTLVQKPYVDRYFELIFRNISSRYRNLPGYEPTVYEIIWEAKRQLDLMKGYQDQPAFKSINGIYQRFFNPDPESGSFYAIANMQSDLPGAREVALEHQYVLNGIISSHKFVIRKDYLKRSFNGFSDTRTDWVKKFKNRIKDGIIDKLFIEERINDSLIYKLSDYAKKTFFSNHFYRIIETEKGLEVSIGKNSLTIREEDIKNSNTLFYEFKPNFSNKAVVAFSSKSALYRMLIDLGIVFDQDFFYSFINETAAENGDRSNFELAKNTNMKFMVDIALRSFLILARQFNEETGGQIGGRQNVIIEKIASRRNERISVIKKIKILSHKTNGRAELEGAFDPPVYSPSTLYELFESIAHRSMLIRYEIDSPTVAFMDGSKKAVDKYPTTMQRVISSLQSTKSKIGGIILRINDNNILNGIEEKITEEQYLKSEYPALYSGMYQNKLVTGELEISEPLYYHIKHVPTNRTEDLRKIRDAEYLKEVFRLLVGDGFLRKYYHPLDFQPDRGFLTVVEIGYYGGSGHRYFPIPKTEGFGLPDPESTKAAEYKNVYSIPFHHAGRLMIEVYGLVRNPDKASEVSDALASLDHEKIRDLFLEYEKFLQDSITIDPAFVNALTERKHYHFQGNKIVAPPLLKSQIKRSFKSFLEGIESEYLNFAEHIYEILSDNVSSEGAFYLTKKLLDGVWVLNDKRFYNWNNEIISFTELRKDPEKYAELSKQEKINQYHPAYFSMFLTYYVNQKYIAERMNGPFYLNADYEETYPDEAYSYLTDNAKFHRLFSIPKLEPVCMEEDFETGFILNREAMTSSINVGYISDSVGYFNTNSSKLNENHVSHSSENFLEKDFSNFKEEFQGDRENRSIFISPIFYTQLKLSCTNDLGLSNGRNIRAFLHSYSPKSGNLHLIDGLMCRIGPEQLNSVDKNYLGLIQIMYRTAMISGTRFNLPISLYDILRLKMKESSMEEALDYVQDVYFKARANEGGYSMRGDIVHILACSSSNYGARVGNNPLNEIGHPELKKTFFDTVFISGFGFY